MNGDIERFLKAQNGPEGINEAIRQIKSGEISGDWMVWTFPTYESNLESIIWAQMEKTRARDPRARLELTL